MALKLARATAASEQESPILKIAGTYHLAVTCADESPVTIDRNTQAEKAVNGFEIQFQVVCGDFRQKLIDLTFYNPNGKSERDDAFNALKQTRILEVLGVLPYNRGDEDQEGVEVELIGRDGSQILAGRQMIATFKQNGDYVKLDGLKFWHVDDPNAPKIEMNKEWLDSIPKELRRDASTFPKPAVAQAAANSKANGKPATRVNVDNMGATPPPSNDVDDI